MMCLQDINAPNKFWTVGAKHAEKCFDDRFTSIARLKYARNVLQHNGQKSTAFNEEDSPSQNAQKHLSPGVAEGTSVAIARPRRAGRASDKEIHWQTDLPQLSSQKISSDPSQVQIDQFHTMVSMTARL